MPSSLTAFSMVQEGSEATPGLFNRIFSTLSDNIGTVNVASSSGSFTAPASGTSAAVAINANSNFTDYLFLNDNSNARSDYIIGSHIGGTADGLNIWDNSGQTMIASFSKQSIRFYQNVVGPVFDVGGALANTLNAATFGSGADSKESRIQAAISAASIGGVARVYVPANMYPYSAGSISFATTVQMVREGGDWSVYDIRAYGASGDGIADDRLAMVSVNSNASAAGVSITVTRGTYRSSASVTFSVPTVHQSGGVIAPDAGIVMFMAQPPIAGRFRIFGGSGAVRLPGLALGGYLFPEWWGASADNSGTAGAAVTTTAITNCITTDFSAAGKKVEFAIGTYPIASSGISLANPNSLTLQGGASGSGSVLKLASGTGPVLTLGDGTFQPFHCTLRDLTIHANDLPTGNAALYFDSVNIFDIDNVEISSITGGTGVSNDSSKLFQEMYFHRLAVYGDDNGLGRAVDIAPTGNVNFDQTNLEACQIGLRVRGQLYAPVTYSGGHIERCPRGVDADDCQMVMYGTTTHQGDIVLGSGVHASSIVASVRDSSTGNGALSDLGFGNKVVLAGGVRLDGKAQKHPAIATDGMEWLRTANSVDDPLFLEGVSTWATTNAVVTAGMMGMPGAPHGRTLEVKATAANGYASRTFSVEGGNDYVLSVGHLVHSDNTTTNRFAVYDESDVLLYDSSTLTYAPPYGSGMFAKIHRKRIQVASGTTRQVKIRVYATQSNQTTMVPLLLFSKSATRMASDVIGGTQSGSGTSIAFRRDMTSGNISIQSTTFKHFGPAFVYFQASVMTDNTISVGVGGDGNQATGGAQLTMWPSTATQEYCLYAPGAPDTALVTFYNFFFADTLNVSDLCVVPIYPQWTSPNALYLSDGSALIPSYAYRSDRSLGLYRSGVSAIGLTYGQFQYPSGTALLPSMAFSSESSLGFYRSGNSTVVQSYGTLQAPAIWATSGVSIGNATAGGTLIPAISSTSSKIGAFVVQGSASSFTRVVWAAAQPGDQILTTVQPDAAVSSMSSGLVPWSHCTVAGQIEMRLSNVSTLAQNQSSKTYYFTRLSPF